MANSGQPSALGPEGGLQGSADIYLPHLHHYVDPSLANAQVSPSNVDLPSTSGIGNKRVLTDDDGTAKKPGKKQRKIEYDEHGNAIPKETRPRALRACDACRKNKSRCELQEADNPNLCRRCSVRGVNCTWDLPPQQRKPKADKSNNDAASPGTAQMAHMLAPYMATPNSAGNPNFDTSLLNHFNSGTLNIPSALAMASAHNAKDIPNTIQELRDAIVQEEAEVERLELLLQYKTAVQHTENFKSQLLGMEGIKTPPGLAHGSNATRAEREQLINGVAD